jgi:hypothetical protein
LQEVTVSLIKTKKARAATRASAAAATGANAARDRARDAADLARDRARDAADVARDRARDATDLARTRASDAADLARARASDAASQVIPRARDAAAQIVPLGKRVGTTAAGSVQQGVGQGVHDAREWAAPLIEDAATAVSDTVAPKVAAALKATARRVEPGRPKSGMRKLLGWPGALTLAVLAVGGAAVAVLLRKRQAPPPPPYPGEDEAEDQAQDTASGTAPAGLDAEANGRVRAPGA